MNRVSRLGFLGIVPSIEIQTIIGHTDRILDSGDCSGQDWGKMGVARKIALERRAGESRILLPRLGACDCAYLDFK